jgi:hypothetical protein
MGNRLCPTAYGLLVTEAIGAYVGVSFPLDYPRDFEQSRRALTLLRWQKARKVTERQSLRVTVVILFVLVIFFFAIVLFIFFVFWLFSNEDIVGM